MHTGETFQFREQAAKLQNDVHQWASATFGTDRKPEAPLYHLPKEINELYYAIREKEAAWTWQNRAALEMEFADCLILILYYLSLVKVKVMSFNYDDEPVIVDAELYCEDLQKKVEVVKKNANMISSTEYIYCVKLYKRLVFGFVHYTNKPMDTLLYTANKKLNINKKRKWSAPDEHGVCHHIDE